MPSSLDVHTRVQENNELSLRQRMDQLSAAVPASPSAVLVTSTQTLPPPSVNAQLIGGENQGLPASVHPPIPAAAYQSAAIVHPSEVSVELANNNRPGRAGAGAAAQVRRAVRSGSRHGPEASGRQARPRQAVTREPTSTARDVDRP